MRLFVDFDAVRKGDLRVPFRALAATQSPADPAHRIGHRRSPRIRIRYPTAAALVLVLAIALAPVAGATTGYSATLSGLQEVPANASPGTGSAFFVLDNSGTTMTWSVTFSGLVGP